MTHFCLVGYFDADVKDPFAHKRSLTHLSVANCVIPLTYIYL